MNRLWLFALLCLPFAGKLHAQPVVRDAAGVAGLIPAPSILRNSIVNLNVQGDTLWVGPMLNLTTDGGRTWQVSDADSLLDTRNRVFSLDIKGDVIWVGLGYTSRKEGDSFPAAGGFLFSEDGGRTFTYRFPQLDAPGDTLLTYGVSTLNALDVITPEQSPPYDIEYDPLTGDVWVAAWASGIRRSSDQGQTWQRVVLPPDFLEEIQPDIPYDFRVDPRGGAQGYYNHTGFSILVDETGTVWAGTAVGVNRSLDQGLSWTRFSYNGEPSSLTGSWVISIEEQQTPGRNPVWMATWNAAEAGERGQDGVTVTRDGGRTFEQVLIGERIYDFAFLNRTVYAAGRNGLFISEDDGESWRTVRDFSSSQGRPDRVIRPDAEVYSVATTSDALWVGTSDGLLKSTDGGTTWQLFRAEVPLHPDQPTASVPDVDTFAYPNPFSPAGDRFVRIRYELAGSLGVDIRIFDFGMRLVREMDEDVQPQGVREAIWDGRDSDGLRVANGAYFYAVRAGDKTTWGKILVVE